MLGGVKFGGCLDFEAEVVEARRRHWLWEEGCVREGRRVLVVVRRRSLGRVGDAMVVERQRDLAMYCV